ncbi:MAG: response regulator [Campylobacterales bacterium]|nr:response regulator [Campylobacterales bacterium]
MENLNILVIEDEIFAFMNIERSLLKIGFKNIFLGQNRGDIEDIIKEKKIDLIYSDINLNQPYDGIDIVLELEKKTKIPVIFITANKEDELYIKSSNVNNLGGFLIKPYRFEELKALSLIALTKYNLLSSKKIAFKDYIYNNKEKILLHKNQEIHLTKKEHSLLYLLLSNKNNYVTYEIIKNHLWHGEYVSDTSLRVMISRFKKKIKDLNIILDWGRGIGIFLD